MVKHVYYKKQATGCTWHLLLKMEKATAFSIRKERDRKRKAQTRKELLMMGYINIKHPLVYKEAEQYYVKLDNIYHDKLDLRKTPRFKELTKIHIGKDNMMLKIPLMSHQSTQSVQVAEVPPVQHPPTLEVTEQCTNELPPDLETIDETIFADELSPDVIQNIINELRADPDLNKIMEGIEATVSINEEMMDEDIDINIDIEIDLLENELRYW